MNVPYWTTPQVIAGLLCDKAIGYEEAKKALESLRLLGWYSADVIGHFLVEIAGLKEV